MTDRCLRPEDLDALLEDTASSPWQDHLQGCAACRALLAEYQCFLAAAPAAGADPVAAAAALEQRLAPALRRAQMQSGSPSGSGPWSTFLAGLRWRPALATAALAVALLLVFWPQGTERFADPSGQVRGPDPDLQDFRVESVERDAAGRWIVRWPSVGGATDYRIEILDPHLAVVLSRVPDEATRTALDPADLPTVPLGEAWFVRVVALAADRELGSTPLRELPQRP